jgi:DNA-binding transcriptional LysR family regulator
MSAPSHTVRAYLDCQRNVSSTAARLAVHENTVAQRLRRIEERLGHTLRSRSTELNVAPRPRDLTPLAWAGDPPILVPGPAAPGQVSSS